MKSDKKYLIVSVCALLICIIAIFIMSGLLTACSTDSAAGSTADSGSVNEIPESEPELECGYKFKNVDIIFDGGWVGDIAYKSPKSTFNVDEVTLTVSFGSLWAKYGTEDCDIPEYDIYFADIGGYVTDSIYTVKTVREQFFSDEYCITRVVDEGKNWDYHYEFNHTEEITIPKELFTGNEGFIRLMIGGTKIAGNIIYENGYLILGEANIKYQRKGTDEVVLSRRYNNPWDY